MRAQRSSSANDLHSAFSDKSIHGVICTRGGWGSAEILPLLDPKIFIENPKPFIGYSDHSSLHVWLQNKTGLVTFHGPMVAADLPSLTAWMPQAGRARWEARRHGSWARTPDCACCRRVRPRGTLCGGCLSILAESLGTLYAFRAKDSILFLEDIGHKPLPVGPPAAASALCGRAG